MNFVSEQNKEEFNAWIEGNAYTRNHRGEYAERGCMTMPWHNQLDFKLQQDFIMPDASGRKHNLQIALDVNNLLNLLNPAWGTYKTLNNTNIMSWKATDKNDPSLGGVYTFNGGQSAGKSQSCVFSTLASTASTWSMMFSLRYFF